MYVTKASHYQNADVGHFIISYLNTAVIYKTMYFLFVIQSKVPPPKQAWNLHSSVAVQKQQHGCLVQQKWLGSLSGTPPAGHGKGKGHGILQAGSSRWSGLERPNSHILMVCRVWKYSLSDYWSGHGNTSSGSKPHQCSLSEAQISHIWAISVPLGIVWRLSHCWNRRQNT